MLEFEKDDIVLIKDKIAEVKNLALEAMQSPKYGSWDYFNNILAIMVELSMCINRSSKDQDDTAPEDFCTRLQNQEQAMELKSER